MSDEFEANKPNKSSFPTFYEYIDSIITYLTNRDTKFYIRFKWLSPIRVQIEKIYYMKFDGDSKFLKEFKARCFFYLASDLGIDNSKIRHTLLSCEKIDDKYELKHIARLPLEVF